VIEYLSGKDPTQYAVRAYDARSGELSKPIVDPREPGEDMSGFPVTRATSPDGRFAYTLYDDEEHPFVHALDTERGTARCIDLPEDLAGFLGRHPPEQTNLTVSADGRTLTVDEAKTPQATIDTQTLSVTVPQEAPAEPAPSADGGDGPWPLVGFAALALALAGGAAAIVRRRRRPAGAAIS
jgi:MYXO-CTERM domain-containing protein